MPHSQSLNALKTYVATHNEGKLRELKAIFADSPLTLVKPRKYPEVAEDAGSYIGNAILKAQALAALLAQRNIAANVLADDSGLEVDALDGRPGIYSARFGGPEIGWPERRAALLADMRGVPPYRRTARFVCALAFVAPGSGPIAATGTVTGYVLENEFGTSGFGYDPIFLYPPVGCSFAALTDKEKNDVSHRRRAADALLTALHRV